MASNDRSYTVRGAVPGDLDRWMALVDKMRAFFPGMEDGEHRQTVLRNVARGSALCAAQGNTLLGALLFSTKARTLSFLVVDPDQQRCGVATALIREMLVRYPAELPVFVTTYRADDPIGTPARALYKKFGFVEDGIVESFGHPFERLVLLRGGHHSPSQSKL